MSGADGDGAASGRGLDDSRNRPAAAPLRDVAVHPPLEQRGMVRRGKLLTRLDRAPAGSLILLAAPGGYGKKPC